MVSEFHSDEPQIFIKLQIIKK